MSCKILSASIYWLLVLLMACSSDDETSPPGMMDPGITSFAPHEGQTGTTVILNGDNFSTTEVDNVVQFNGTPAFVQSATTTELSVIVPDSATTGKIKVTVAGRAVTSQETFTILSPSIQTIAPMIGSPGLAIKVSGTNFLVKTSANKIFFGSTEGVVNSSTTTELDATIPANSSTGKIIVQVGTQKAYSSEDFVICDGVPELIISNIQILSTNPDQTELTYSCRLTNVGNADLDLSKMAMQNYVSSNSTYEVDDIPAGGWTLDAGGVLAQGESYEEIWTSSANYSEHPNLIITVFAKYGEIVGECNTNNNLAVKAIVN